MAFWLLKKYLIDTVCTKKVLKKIKDINYGFVQRGKKYGASVAKKRFRGLLKCFKALLKKQKLSCHHLGGKDTKQI